MRKVILLVILVSLFSACKNVGSNKFSKNSFKIEGNIKIDGNPKIYLTELLRNSEYIIVDSAVVADDGNFVLEGSKDIPTFFSIDITGYDDNVLLILEPGEEVNLDIESLSFPAKYLVKGSPQSEKIVQLNNDLFAAYDDIMEVQKAYHLTVRDDTLTSDELMSLRKETNKKVVAAVNAHKDSSLQFIEANLGDLVSIIPLYQQIMHDVNLFSPEEDLDVFIKVDKALYEKYPTSESAMGLHELVEKVKTMPLRLGSAAPNFAITTASGEQITLSSFKGKYVLLTFWATWDEPSRAANKDLKRAYNSYKDRGFDIVQISLDKSKEKWSQAIEEDGLNWTQVCDLQFWNSPVVGLYKVQKVPSNFLINREGQIIEKDLVGYVLDDKLKEIFE